MTFDNPGQLKLELLYYGVQLDPPDAVPEDPSGTIPIELPGGLQVTTTCHANYVRHSPYRLKQEKQYWRLVSGQQEIPVRIHRHLESYDKKTTSGIPVSDILSVHGGFVAVEPMGLCRFTKSGLECKYCRHKGARTKTTFTAKDLIEALTIVKKERPIDIVHLSSGFVESEDGGVLGLEPLVHEIRKHFNVFISIDVMPPARNDWIDRTYAMGVDAVYYDIDVFDPELFKQVYPEKEEAFRHQRYLEAMEYAAHTFPSGAVCTHLVLGLEPLGSVRQGIEALTGRGIIPLLTFFRPMAGTPLQEKWQLKISDVAPLYQLVFEQTQKKKISQNWIRQFDVLLTPLEGRFFSEDKAQWKVSLQNFYQTPVGRRTALGMAALRRQLRVRQVKK